MTEHQTLWKSCSHCQRTTTSPFPESVTEPVQYGLRIKGLAAYLHAYQRLPNERLCDTVSHLFCVYPSEGTLHVWLSRAYQMLAPEVVRFMDRFDFPFDNNQSERDLRMMKVKQKVSGGFRSDVEVRIFCRLRSYIAALKKQSLNLLTALQSVFEGQLRIPGSSG